MGPLIKENIPLAPLTTLQIGGSAEFFAEVTTNTELNDAVVWAKEKGVPITVLGGGSNTLVIDEGVRGLVIKIANRGIVYEKEQSGIVTVQVQSGEAWDSFVFEVTHRGLWGLENLSGIPGCVGSAPIQNINAYGVSVSDTISSVLVYNIETGDTTIRTHEACHFSYRDSFFKTEEGKKYIILQVTFRLTTENAVHTAYKSASQSIERSLVAQGITTPTPTDIRKTILAIRKNIGMLSGMYNSAGSFFKNTILTKAMFDTVARIVNEKHASKSEQLSPWYWELTDGFVKVSTAFLMECTPYNKTDFKGKSYQGGIGISPVHTLSLINYGTGSAGEVIAFATHIRETIEKEFGVTIEQEVCIMR